jgi:hypothetical protein
MSSMTMQQERFNSGSDWNSLLLVMLVTGPSSSDSGEFWSESSSTTGAFEIGVVENSLFRRLKLFLTDAGFSGAVVLEG